METKNTSKKSTLLVVVATLLCVFAVIDSATTGILNETGLMLGIVFMAIALSANAKKIENVQINPKVERILLPIILVIIVSGVITAILVA